TAIAARPDGQRFATIEEAEIRRKIIVSAKYFKDQQTAGVHAEILANFITYVAKQNKKHAQFITQYADNYLAGEKKMSLTPEYPIYTLPGDPGDTTVPGANPLPPDDTNLPPQFQTPAEDDTTGIAA